MLKKRDRENETQDIRLFIKDWNSYFSLLFLPNTFKK